MTLLKLTDLSQKNQLKLLCVGLPQLVLFCPLLFTSTKTVCVCVCVYVCVCVCVIVSFSCFLSLVLSLLTLSLSLSTHSSLHKLPLSLGVTRTLETLFVAASADDILGKTQLIHNFSKQDYRVGGDLPKRMEEQVAFVMDRSGKKVEISLWDASGKLL